MSVGNPVSWCHLDSVGDPTAPLLAETLGLHDGDRNPLRGPDRPHIHSPLLELRCGHGGNNGGGSEQNTGDEVGKSFHGIPRKTTQKTYHILDILSISKSKKIPVAYATGF